MQKKALSGQITAFALCCVVFGLLGGILGQFPEMPQFGIYRFFYQIIPGILSAMAGLTVGGALGVILSAAAAVVYILVSHRLYKKATYCRYSSEFSIGLLTFLYFMMCSSIMVKPAVAEEYLSHSFLIFFPVCLFVISVLHALTGAKKKALAQRLGVLLSYLGYSLALAAASRVVLELGLERTVVLPSAAASWFLTLANGTDGALLTCAAALLVQGLLAAMVAFGFKRNHDRSIQRGCWDGGLEMICFFLLVFWSYSPVAGTVVYARGLKYWLLLLILTVVFARKSIKLWLSNLVFVTAVPCLYYAIVFLKRPVDRLLTAAAEWAAPAKEWAVSFVYGLIPGGEEMAIASLCVVAAVVLLASVLLYLPILRLNAKFEKQDVDACNVPAWYNVPIINMLPGLLFLTGVLLHGTAMPYAVVGYIVYGCIVAAVVLLALVLTGRLMSREKLGMLLYGTLIALLLTPAYYLFAGSVGLVVAAVVLAIIVMLTLKEGIESSGSTSSQRIENAKDYFRRMDRIEEAYLKGDISDSGMRARVELATSEAIETDRELRK